MAFSALMKTQVQVFQPTIHEFMFFECLCVSRACGFLHICCGWTKMEDIADFYRKFKSMKEFEETTRINILQSVKEFCNAKHFF